MNSFRITRLASAVALALGCAVATAATYDWTTGSFVAGTTAPNPLPAGDVLTLTTGASKTFDAVAFVNQGQVTHSGGALRLINGASVLNGGTWDIGNVPGPEHAGGAGTTFVNDGTVRKVAGTGTSNFGSAGLQVGGSGTWEVQTGTLSFTSPDTLFGSGTRFVGAGVNRIGVALAMEGTMHSENLVLASGSRVAGSAVVLEGDAEWQGGTLTGGWTMAAGSTLNLTGVGGKRVEGAGTEVVLAGTLDWTGAGGIVVADGATLRNQGLLQRSGATGGSSVTASGSGARFVNEGLVRNSGGGSLSLAMSGGTLVNAGTIEADGGTVTLPGSFVNTGRLAGVGQYSVATGLTNAGVLAPGAAAGGVGTLVLGNGNSFVQAAGGTLAIDITGLGAHDVLDVVGSGFGDAALAGTLALNCLGACSLAVGDEITILRAANTISGQFEQVVLSGFATGAFDVVYELNAGTADDYVRLRVTEAVTPVPEPQAWALWAAGLGMLGFVTRRRLAR